MISATYDPSLGRIRLQADTLNVAATYVVFDRTLNGIRYTTVRGGSNVSVELPRVDDYEFPVNQEITYRARSFDDTDTLLDTFTTTITQDVDGVWLKSITRPFLNRKFYVQSQSEIERPSRSGVFDVVGRTYPIAVNEVRSSRRFSIELITNNETETADLEYVLASGDSLFMQAPSASAVPTLYVTVGDVSQRRYSQSVHGKRQQFIMPLTEIAPPSPQLVGSTVSYQTILNDFATYTAVLTEFATYGDVLDYVANPQDVIVP